MPGSARRISAEDFKNRIPFLEKDIRPDRIAVARHVLVEGLGPQYVANLMGLRRPASVSGSQGPDPSKRCWAPEKLSRGPRLAGLGGHADGSW